LRQPSRFAELPDAGGESGRHAGRIHIGKLSGGG